MISQFLQWDAGQQWGENFIGFRNFNSVIHQIFNDFITFGNDGNDMAVSCFYS